MQHLRAAIIACMCVLFLAAYAYAQTGVCTDAACSYMPLMRLEPTETPIPPTATPTEATLPTATPGAELCAAEYPTVCIPPPPPDLNCSDIPYRRFTVLPPDRHNFDTDHDGIWCES